MTTQIIPLPLQGTMAGFRRFSVDEYHRLIEIGLLTEDDHLELLEGYLVHKMARNPPHDGTIQKVAKQLRRALPAGWDLRVRSAATLTGSEPEPDLAVARGDENTYLTRHPGAADLGLVVEVADSTLAGDRADKGRIYARAGVVAYWIVNLSDRQVEVYDAPSGPTATPAFARRTDYRSGDDVPFVLDGVAVANLAVSDLLP